MHHRHHHRLLSFHKRRVVEVVPRRQRDRRHHQSVSKKPKVEVSASSSTTATAVTARPIRRVHQALMDILSSSSSSSATAPSSSSSSSSVQLVVTIPSDDDDDGVVNYRMNNSVKSLRLRGIDQVDLHRRFVLIFKHIRTTNWNPDLNNADWNMIDKAVIARGDELEREATLIKANAKVPIVKCGKWPNKSILIKCAIGNGQGLTDAQRADVNRISVTINNARPFMSVAALSDSVAAFSLRLFHDLPNLDYMTCSHTRSGPISKKLCMNINPSQLCWEKLEPNKIRTNACYNVFKMKRDAYKVAARKKKVASDIYNVTSINDATKWVNDNICCHHKNKIVCSFE